MIIGSSCVGKSININWSLSVRFNEDWIIYSATELMVFLFNLIARMSLTLVVPIDFINFLLEMIVYLYILLLKITISNNNTSR